MKFGVVIIPDAPFPELRKRFRWLEERGFDQIYVGDMSHEYEAAPRDGKVRLRATGTPFLEGWTVVTDLAMQTERVRIGPLVSSPIMRGPVLLAMQAAAVDQISGGRLDLGIGLGMGTDHRPMGVGRWSWQERAARFREYVALVDGLLRCHEGSYTFAGDYYQTDQPTLNPGSVQRPRPPFTIAGLSRSAVKTAAEFGDTWNAVPQWGASLAENLPHFRKRLAQLDELCETAKRDPAAVRRSLTLHDQLDLEYWDGPGGFEEIVTRCAEVGFQEIVLNWPDEPYVPLLDRVASDVIPTFRS